MPELPEVHTIACGLEKAVAGWSVASAQVLRPECLQGRDELFLERVPGSKVVSVGRRGKALLIHLDPPLVLGIHLKMTGRVYVPQPGDETDKHTNFRLELKGPGSDKVVFFKDVRRFGYCRVMLPGDVPDWTFLASLGPEPLELEAEKFLEIFRARRGQIKGLLLNQTVLAGIGNIYADESLFRAGIRPGRPAHRIPEKQLLLLHASIQEVLSEAIAECGSSISDYRDAQGNAGAFQNRFRVYGRAGKDCLVCGKTLQQTKVAGRTSVYCPACQS